MGVVWVIKHKWKENVFLLEPLFRRDKILRCKKFLQPAICEIHANMEIIQLFFTKILNDLNPIVFAMHGIWKKIIALKAKGF